MSKRNEIQKLLSEALAHDEAAIAKRRAAGRQLAALRAAYPEHWRNMAGVDATTADMLIGMATGRE